MGGLVGRTITMSNGMQIQPYLKASYVTEHAADNNVYVNDTKLKAKLNGNRTETGFGGVMQLSTNSKVSLDAEYAKGADIEQPYAVSLGYRYLW
ncbi:Pertactin autotransporter precursor [compost metagenome]